MLFKAKHITLLFIALFCISCNQNDYSPKPRGYLRIDFPEKSYQSLDSTYPYTFEYPEYGKIKPDNSQKYWMDLYFPEFKGTIHISYKEVDNNLYQYLEDSRNLAYKHSVKADAINERLFINQNKEVFGTLYEIEGNAASSVQFYLTDSSRHFLRGALYFYTQPNIDSLAPVINFFKKDINHLIETFQWK